MRLYNNFYAISYRNFSLVDPFEQARESYFRWSAFVHDRFVLLQLGKPFHSLGNTSRLTITLFIYGILSFQTTIGDDSFLIYHQTVGSRLGSVGLLLR